MEGSTVHADYINHTLFFFAGGDGSEGHCWWEATREGH